MFLAQKGLQLPEFLVNSQRALLIFYRSTYIYHPSVMVLGQAHQGKSLVKLRCVCENSCSQNKVTNIYAFIGSNSELAFCLNRILKIGKHRFFIKSACLFELNLCVMGTG